MEGAESIQDVLVIVYDSTAVCCEWDLLRVGLLNLVSYQISSSSTKFSKCTQVLNLVLEYSCTAVDLVATHVSCKALVVYNMALRLFHNHTCPHIRMHIRIHWSIIQIS